MSKIVFDPGEPARVYVALYAVGETDIAGCYVSEDAGETWRAANEGIATGRRTLSDLPIPLQAEWSFDLALAPSQPRTLYLATNFGLYRSDDGAQHWQPTVHTKTVKCIAVDPRDPQHLVIGSQAGALRSRDGGRTWTDITGHLPTEPLPGNPSYEVNFTLPDGTVTKLGGTDKRFVPSLNHLAFDARDPRTVWLAHSFGIYRATLLDR